MADEHMRSWLVAGDDERFTREANTATMKQRLTVQSIRLEGPYVVRASSLMEKDLPETMLRHAPHTNTCKKLFI